MKNSATLLLFVLLLAFLQAIAAIAATSESAPPLVIRGNNGNPGAGYELVRKNGAAQLFLRAEGLASRGHEEDSAVLLQELLPLANDQLKRRARILLMLDERALFHYNAALQAILALPARDRDADIVNRIRMLQAIADVPGQSAERSSPLRLDAADVTARIGNADLHLGIDTGASFSVLSRSAAARAGLRVRPVGYAVSSEFGGKVRTDIAVGDIAFASARVRRAIFLILPDRAFEGTPPLAGVIGLPVLRALGTLDFGASRGNGTEQGTPLGFDEGNLVVRIRSRGAGFTCRLDTGAQRSTFSTALLPRATQAAARRSGARLFAINTAGGTRRVPFVEQPLAIAVAGREVLLQKAMVVPPGLADSENRCSLGADAIQALRPLRLDFSRMRLVLL